MQNVTGRCFCRVVSLFLPCLLRLHACEKTKAFGQIFAENRRFVREIKEKRRHLEKRTQIGVGPLRFVPLSAAPVSEQELKEDNKEATTSLPWLLLESYQPVRATLCVGIFFCWGGLPSPPLSLKVTR